MFRNIVIGVKGDGKPTALFDLATSVAEPGARLHLVTLVQVGRDEDEMGRLQKAQQHLETWAAPLRDRGYEVVTDTNIVPINAGGALARYAEQHETDLLVIGLTKRSRVGKALLGSDAQTALLTAPCPVLSAHV